MINISVPESENQLKPRIVVFGVGGAGSNAINNMIRLGLDGIDFVSANTDAQALASNLAPKKLQLGVTVTRGLGAGARPDVGRAAAEEQLDEINAFLDGAHMAFITAGMGGGTGTGAAPVIARAARERGILTVGVVTRPFQFEGAVRSRSAEQGIQGLQQYVDTLIVIPNQNLFNIANDKTTFADAFKMADDVLYQGVRGVTDLIMTPGQINLDFADIRSVMSEMGKAMMGTGEAEGDNRAHQAAEMAINNPLLDDASIKGARGVLINITGGPDLTLFEVEEAANRIRDEVDPDANIIFGTAMDDTMGGKIRISVVATGIDMQIDRQVGSGNASNVVAIANPPLNTSAGSNAGFGAAPVQTVARTVAGSLFGGSQSPAQQQQQAAPLSATAQGQARTMASGNNPVNWYAGMQQESVGNTALAPQQPDMNVQPAPAPRPVPAPLPNTPMSGPVRGLRQEGGFFAPAPVQAPRAASQPVAQAPLSAPVQHQTPVAPAPRKPGFGERVLGKVKALVTQLEAEPQPQAAPQTATHQQQAQPQQRQASAHHVTQGGRAAGLPPVTDAEIDIPSFLRRQAN